MHSSRPRGQAVPALIFSAGTLLGSCASLDVGQDLDDAQRLVAARSDVAVDWKQSWSPGSTPWPPVGKLSADDVARLALAHHPGIRATVESIATARADYVQAHLLPNPVLNFTLGLPSDGGATSPGMGSLLQPIAALWQRPAAIDASTSKLRAAVLSVSDAALELVAEARLAHAQLVFAERDLLLERELADVDRESLTLTEQRLREGEGDLLERNRAALDAAASAIRWTDAKVRRDRAQRAVLALCGVAGSMAFPQVDLGVDELPSWFEQIEEPAALALAHTQRLDVAAMEALASGSIDDLRLAELRRLRSVALGLGFQRNFSGREALGPTLALEIPIFDDGRAVVAKAESMARTAAAEVERVRQAALAEVRSAWVRLRGDAEHLSLVRRELLDVAIDNRRLAESIFEAGAGDRISVLDFVRRELRARLEMSKIKLAVVEAAVELERAVGGRIDAGPEALRSDAAGEFELQASAGSRAGHVEVAR